MSELSIIPAPQIEETEATALTIVSNTSLGLSKTREFKKKTKHTITRFSFVQWLRFKFNVTEADTEGLKAARKTVGVNQQYRDYCKELNTSMAVARAKATEDGTMKVRAVEVGICNVSGDVVDYVEKYGEVKEPKERKNSKTQISELEKQVAELTAALAATVNQPSIEV